MTGEHRALIERIRSSAGVVRRARRPVAVVAIPRPE